VIEEDKTVAQLPEHQGIYSEEENPEAAREKSTSLTTLCGISVPLRKTPVNL
jgi:hypothetical protein